MDPSHPDPVAPPMFGDSVTQHSHPADRLVAEHDRQARRRDPALHLIQVRVAHAAGMHAHQHLPGSGLGYREPAQLHHWRVPSFIGERAGAYQHHRPHGLAAHADAPE